MIAIKKRIAIECFQYDGDLKNANGEFYVDRWAVEAFQSGIIYFKDGEMYIKTLEGDHHVSVGDYVIRGVNNELYPCKPDIFEKTYDIFDENAQAVDPAEKPQNFSWALQWLKDGHKVARLNWNGKGQFVTMQNGSTVLGSQMRNENAKNFYGDREVKIRPHLDIKTADDSYVCGWTPSTGDLFAEDWVIVK